MILLKHSVKNSQYSWFFSVPSKGENHDSFWKEPTETEKIMILKTFLFIYFFLSCSLLKECIFLFILFFIYHRICHKQKKCSLWILMEISKNYWILWKCWLLGQEESDVNCWRIWSWLDSWVWICFCFVVIELDITCLDLDTIEMSNLNRQFLFRKSHVGQSKSKVAVESVLLL